MITTFLCPTALPQRLRCPESNTSLICFLNMWDYCTFSLVLKSYSYPYTRCSYSFDLGDPSRFVGLSPEGRLKEGLWPNAWRGMSKRMPPRKQTNNNNMRKQWRVYFKLWFWKCFNSQVWRWTIHHCQPVLLFVWSLRTYHNGNLESSI